ncbi:head-tail joining protein [Falsiroseomonas sp. HW251]|uniref:head-tail joining protein n=1 Tax=Falsiroseomonas sp. HW251 TaxID=3390998 RepID=UPI003D322DE6
MSTAFDAALASLHADPNMGTDAEWRAAAGGAWRPLRVLLSAPADAVAGLGGPGGRAVALEATLRVADLVPDAPRRGDLLRRLSPPETWKIEDVEPDPLGLSWRVSLARSA